MQKTGAIQKCSDFQQQYCVVATSLGARFIGDKVLPEQYSRDYHEIKAIGDEQTDNRRSIVVVVAQHTAHSRLHVDA